VLYQPNQPIEDAMFPLEGVVSMLTIMKDGTGIEVATIGNEGMVGLPIILGPQLASSRFIVQVPGSGLRMSAEILREETRRDTPLRRVLVLYHAAFLKQISQSVACNGLHTVEQRCCRWLLMTRDRVTQESFPLTHEFLAEMLGVRRSSVTEVLHPLRAKGLLQAHRGRIEILDRPGLEALACECYASVNDEYSRLFP
jgi:CRP-like cAMP-binding protein